MSGGLKPRATLRALGLAALILCTGCSYQDTGRADKPSTHGGYVKLFNTAWGEVDKLCDNGRLIYVAPGNHGASSGYALSVIEHAPECNGNAYVVDTAK